jgi:protein-S-isoprenylcysteine O-methyltransferase Ste14
MPDTKRDRDRIGIVLVAVQFLLIAAVAVLAAPAFARGRVPLAAWAFGGAGVLLGLWALCWNRPGNFNIRPTPRAGGYLVEQGPYRWIRHPMYTAVIACGVAGAIAAATLAAWMAAAALAAVLAVKAAYEERGMLAEHPGYAAYRARTNRFVPGLY